MTNGEMIAHIGKRGHIALPVMTAHDVHHVIVDKADLIAILDRNDPDAPSPWTISNPRADGVRTLDVGS